MQASNFHHSMAKRMINGALLLLCFCLFIAVFPFLAAAIKLTSRGPVFYRQDRIGLNGQVYDMWKFRTMRTDAESSGKPQWATSNDPRITPIGRLLRKHRIDELPNIFNVLAGEMSMIGPRPERPFFVEQFIERMPDYGNRHLVKPGITGLAQVTLPYDDDEQSVVRKLSADLEYVEHATLRMELKIAFRTVSVIFTGFGAR